MFAFAHREIGILPTWGMRSPIMQLRWVLLIIRTNKLLVRQSHILTSATFLICYCSAWNYKFILSLPLNHSMAGYISYIILHRHHDVWNCGELSKMFGLWDHPDERNRLFANNKHLEIFFMTWFFERYDLVIGVLPNDWIWFIFNHKKICKWFWLTEDWHLIFSEGSQCSMIRNQLCPKYSASCHHVGCFTDSEVLRP